MRKFDEKNENGFLPDLGLGNIGWKNFFKSKSQRAKEAFLNEVDKIKTFAEEKEDCIILFYICKYGVEKTKSTFGLHYINQEFMNIVDNNGPFNNSNRIEVENIVENAKENLTILNYTLLHNYSIQRYPEVDMSLFLAIQNKLNRIVTTGEELLG